MSIELMPPFQANIQVKDQEEHILFTKTCLSKEEFVAFVKEYGQSKEGWELMQGMVMPLRTHTITAFGQDFFFPTFTQYTLWKGQPMPSYGGPHASRCEQIMEIIDDIVMKIIAPLGFLVIDIISLPIRFIATPFRMCYNAYYPEENNHPLTQLIQENGQAAFEAPVVNLYYEVQAVHIFPSEEAHKYIIKGTTQVALQTISFGMEKHPTEVQEREIYLKEATEWRHNTSRDYRFNTWGIGTWLRRGTLFAM